MVGTPGRRQVTLQPLPCALGSAQGSGCGTPGWAGGREACLGGPHCAVEKLPAREGAKTQPRHDPAALVGRHLAQSRCLILPEGGVGKGRWSLQLEWVRARWGQGQVLEQHPEGLCANSGSVDSGVSLKSPKKASIPGHTRDMIRPSSHSHHHTEEAGKPSENFPRVSGRRQVPPKCQGGWWLRGPDQQLLPTAVFEPAHGSQAAVTKPSGGGHGRLARPWASLSSSRQRRRQGHRQTRPGVPSAPNVFRADASSAHRLTLLSARVKF